jgi:PAS domain S-box-containing protein
VSRSNSNRRGKKPASDVGASPTVSLQADTPTPQIVADGLSLDGILQDLPVGVIIAEAPSGRILYGNRRIREMYGEGYHASRNVEDYANWRPHRLDGRPFEPQDLPLARALQGQMVRGEEMMFPRPNGDPLIVSVNARPLCDRSGRIVAAMITVEDITQRKRTEQVLIDGEQRLRFVLENSPDTIFVQDADLRYLWISKPSAPLLAEDCLGKTDLELIKDPNEARQLVAIKRKVMAENRSTRTEIPLTFQGRPGCFEATFEPWRDGNGHVIGLAGYVRDITETKQAEQALRAGEQTARRQLAEIQAIYDSAHVGLCVFDLDLRYLRINQRLAEINGIPAADHIGKTVRDIVPDLAPLAREIVDRIFQTGQPVLDIEFSGTTAARPDVQRYWVEQWLPLKDAEGNVVAINVSAEEVTERKQAEQTLQQRNLHLQILSDTASQLLRSRDPQALMDRLCRQVMEVTDCHAFFNYLLDHDARRLHLNAWAGIPEEAAGQIEWLAYDSESVCGCVAQVGQRIIAENLPGSGDPRLQLARSFDLKAYACHPLVIQTGVIGTLSFGSRSRNRFSDEELGMMNTVADLVAVAMDRVRGERQLQEVASTLERRVAERTAEAQGRARQLQRLAAELTQAEQRERQRLAEVLHDHLQQLLVGAKFNLGVLRSQIKAKEPRQAISEVDDLLDESLAASRSLTVELSPPVLHEGTFTQVLHWLAHWMNQKHRLTVEVQADEQVNPQAEEVRVLLFQAVRELLFNTVKHAKVDRARVRMSRSNPGLVQVVVEDKGVGFDPQRKRDEQVDSHVGGFGLFSIHERLELLGGTVRIESRPGEGTRVTLTAPSRLSDSPASQAAVQAIPHSADPTVQEPAGVFQEGQAIRVLLADDHAVLRDGLTRLLQIQGGIQVVGQAKDGQEAVELALRLRPEVVVMDVDMPRLGGVEATRRIVRDRPGTKVIGLSMHVQEDVAAQMQAAGAAGYLTKTSAPNLLVEMIRKQVVRPDGGSRA